MAIMLDTLSFIMRYFFTFQIVPRVASPARKKFTPIFLLLYRFFKPIHARDRYPNATYSCPL